VIRRAKIRRLRRTLHHLRVELWKGWVKWRHETKDVVRAAVPRLTPIRVPSPPTAEDCARYREPLPVIWVGKDWDQPVVQACPCPAPR
jgi:hypothetical protein